MPETGGKQGEQTLQADNQTAQSSSRQIGKPYAVVRGVGILIACFTALCFLCSLGSTAVNFSDLKEQGVELIPENPGSFIRSLILYTAGAGILSWVLRKLHRHLGLKRTVLTVCGVELVLSLALIFLLQYAPVADQKLVADSASQINQGDYSSLDVHSYGYLAAHQNQLGMVSLLRVLFFLFGDGNYLSFQILNAILAVLGIGWCGARIVQQIWESEDTTLWYETLYLTALPILIYVPYLYNDLLSTSLVMIAAALFLDSSFPKHVLSFFVLALAVSLRHNALIPAIAFALAILFSRKYRLNSRLLQIACLAALIWGLNWLIRLPYREALKGVSSIPAIAYVAMGMQGRGGGYNGFNAQVYWNSGGDPDLIQERCLEVMDKSIADWKANPDLFRTFLRFKFQSQWNAPAYECLQMVLYTSNGSSALVASLQNGLLRRLLQSFLKGFELFYYPALTAGVLALRKKDGQNSVLAYTIFGGFLFSMIWEAKSRYILPYMVYGLTIACFGLHAGWQALHRHLPVHKARP